jgi:hypothetical protein
MKYPSIEINKKGGGVTVIANYKLKTKIKRLITVLFLTKID